MSEAKHTPGPWAYDGPPDNIHIVEAARPHMRVCFLTSNGPTEANARLIAAAPEMLEVLKRCEAMVSTDDGPPNWDSVRAIIAKATEP